MTRDLRTTVGVAMAISLVIIFLSGFFAKSSRDLVLIIFGFAFGLFAAYLVETLKRTRQRNESRNDGPERASL